MTKPSVSFVLLTYNQQDTVCEAVESVLAQEGLNLEIVISDDCSTDNTFELIKSTVKNYKGPHKIILNRNTTNLGIAGNLNKVHLLSSGEIIIAGAGDDISYPQRSKLILGVFTRETPLLVCSYATTIDQEGITLPGSFHNALFYKQKWDLHQVAKSKSLYIGATGAWHRSLYEQYGLLERETIEDLVLGFRAALEDRIHVINQELVKYRLGGLTTFISESDSYSSFINRKQRSYIVIQAVVRQRIRDALHYGIDENSRIMKILKLENTKAIFRLNFYEGKYSTYWISYACNIIIRLLFWNLKRKNKRKLIKIYRQKRQSENG